MNGLTRAEKINRARYLKGRHGWTNRRIAADLGVTPSCVQKWLNPEAARRYSRTQNAKPERQAAKLAWRRAHDHSPCPECGQPMSPERKGHQRCDGCHRTAEAEATACKVKQAQELWEAGVSILEMAEALGYASELSMKIRIVEWRRAGHLFPYRRRPQVYAA